MPEDNTNLWAPWRAEYIRGLGAGDSLPCFLCTYANIPGDDATNGVIHRGRDCLVVMNRYPYTNGHLLIAPTAHVDNLSALAEPALLEMTTLARDAMNVLHDVVHAQGYNLGINFGRCAGAGLPGHIHTHIVPRWGGDTNFMTTVGDVRIIPEDMDGLYKRLCDAGTEVFKS